MKPVISQSCSLGAEPSPWGLAGYKENAEARATVQARTLEPAWRLRAETRWTLAWTNMGYLTGHQIEQG